MPHVDILYNHLHHSPNSGSIYNAVNTFLKVISTEQNKTSSASLQEKDVPPAKRRNGIGQDLVSAKQVCENISCHESERSAFTKHL